MLEYNMHKERVGSLRFEKGKSETMKTLEGLKERGVKVDLGIPDEVRRIYMARRPKLIHDC